MSKKRKIILLVIAIIIIIIAGFSVYYCKIERNKSNNSENTTVNSELDNNTIKEEQVEYINVSEELVNQLYKYILKSDDFKYSFAWSASLEPASFYRDNKTTYSTLSNMEKMLIVLRDYDENEIKKVDKTTVEDFINTIDIQDVVHT